MRRIGIVAVLATLLMAFTASAALAVPPTSVTQTGGLHVCEGTVLDVSPQSTGAGKFLTATGEVCGAGTTATATLSATATATVGCVTRGGGEPMGLEEVATATTASETFRTRAGRGSFDVSTEPLSIEDFAFECPSATDRGPCRAHHLHGHHAHHYEPDRHDYGNLPRHRPVIN